MSLIGFDGFDNYNTKTDFVTNQGNLTWFGVGAGPDHFDTYTRFGIGKSMNVSNIAYAGGTSYVLMSTGYVGFALSTNQVAGGSFVVECIDGFHGVTHAVAGVLLSSGAAFIIDQAGANAGTSAAGIVPQNTWGYFEVRFTVGHAGVGQVVIRWNGQVILQNTTADFWNTASGGTQSFNQFTLRPEGVGASAFIDDLYLNDNNTDAGTFPNNSFNGDVSVTPVYPNNNFSVGWTPLAGTNWQEISETTFDGDTTYNSTSSAGAKDLFSLPSLPAYVSGVIAVQILGAYREDSTGSRTLSQHLNSGGTEVAGVSRTLNTGYSYWKDHWTLDPATGSNWSVTAVNNALIGYNLDT